jgi:hypothetical protein
MFDKQASERLALGLAAGDRAADLQAARARWEGCAGWDRSHPGSQSAAQPGMARRWLGAWLIGLGTRLQGHGPAVGPTDVRTRPAAAR